MEVTVEAKDEAEAKKKAIEEDTIEEMESEFLFPCTNWEIEKLMEMKK